MSSGQVPPNTNMTKHVRFKEDSVAATATSGTTTRTGGTKGKKVLIVHYNESVRRIAFTERAPPEAIEKSIRRELGMADQPFSLIDGDGDSLVIDGSMDCGEVWLSQELIHAAKKNRAAATVRANRQVSTFKESLDKLPIENAIQYIFDPASGKWNEQKIQVKIDTEPFAQGSLRKAYYLHVVSEPDEVYVGKISIDQYEDRETYFQDVETQMYAKKWAEMFNMYKPPKKVDFVMASLISLVNRENQPLYAIEKYILGSYRKHNNNYGYVSEDERNTPQAFSHFTYEASGRKVLICDIQGVSDMYTDPQMHTEETQISLGKGNLGSRGFMKFLSTHQCNAICQYLKLPVINAKRNDMGTRPDAGATVMTYQHIDVLNFQLYANEQNGLLPKNIEVERKRLLNKSGGPNNSSDQINGEKTDRSCCCTIL